MGKSKSSTLKFTKSNVQALGKIALGCEGLISKDTFLQYSTQNMLDKYVADGYMKLKSTDGKNYQYQTTEKFNTAFRKEYGNQNKNYSNCKFSQSKSCNHSSGLQTIVKAIDRKDIINDNVVITSGGTLSENYSKYSHTADFREKAENLYNQHQELIAEYQKEIDRIQSMENISLENYTNMYDLQDQMKQSQMIVELYESKNDLCSPPDAQLTMGIDAFQTQIDNLKYQLEHDDSLSRKEENSLNSVINQMEQYMEQVIYEERTEVSYSVEVITSNYHAIDIQQKVNYETITEQKVIYVRV